MGMVRKPLPFSVVLQKKCEKRSEIVEALVGINFIYSSSLKAEKEGIRPEVPAVLGLPTFSCLCANMQFNPDGKMN